MIDHITQKDKYVTFKSGNEYFGIKIEYVNEIIGYQDITEVPECDDYIKGLINLRGKIIPVMDLRIKFGLVPQEYTDRTCCQHKFGDLIGNKFICKQSGMIQIVVPIITILRGLFKSDIPVKDNRI